FSLSTGSFTFFKNGNFFFPNDTRGNVPRQTTSPYSTITHHPIPQGVLNYASLT
ncbi:unnamed protein product, partial [Heterotrigona itama]